MCERRRWLPALFLFLCNASAAEAQDARLLARVDSVFAQFDHTRSPGCALGVIHDGEFVVKRGYGMANLEHGIALSPTSVFRIGSVSKQFTAAAMVLLQQEGKLSLDDSVRRYVPELPEYERTITIRHLLNHTSGMRDYLTLMALAGKRDDDWYSDNDVVRMLARQGELNFLPGDEFLYSNSGYFLLSQIVKRATGQSLREYAAAMIFAPLGMTHTHFHDDHREVVPNRASGYAPEDMGFRVSMTTLDMVGDGGVFTTVEDLALWDRNFYEPSVGGAAFWGEMLTRGVLSNGDTLRYALGLQQGEYRGLPTVSHSGGFVGFRAQVLRFPSERFTVICLCNVSVANPTLLARSVADVVLEDRLGPREEAASGGGQEREALPPRYMLSADERAEYVGEYYSDELDVAYRIRIVNDTLRLGVGATGERDLSATERDVLRAGFLTLGITRAGDDVSGFLVDAGRVKNLVFTKR